MLQACFKACLRQFVNQDRWQEGLWQSAVTPSGALAASARMPVQGCLEEGREGMFLGGKRDKRGGSGGWDWRRASLPFLNNLALRWAS